MKIAFPVESDQGMGSKVYGHFGSAPCFLVIDSENGVHESVTNMDLHHIHGQCQPMKALSGNTVDAVVVGGIGGGALMGLHSRGYGSSGPWREVCGKTWSS